MIEWICPHCKRRTETKNNIVLKICPGCFETMEINIKQKKLNGVFKDGHTRRSSTI